MSFLCLCDSSKYCTSSFVYSTCTDSDDRRWTIINTMELDKKNVLMVSCSSSKDLLPTIGAVTTETRACRYILILENVLDTLGSRICDVCFCSCVAGQNSSTAKRSVNLDMVLNNRHLASDLGNHMAPVSKWLYAPPSNQGCDMWRVVHERHLAPRLGNA